MKANNTSRTMITLAVSAMLLVAGLQVIKLVFRGKTNGLISDNQYRQHVQNSLWMTEAARRKLEDKRDDQERIQRQHAEMVDAFGGPAAMVAKNPQYDIGGMIRAVAMQCAGEGAVVRVSVDRFTEFSVAIDITRSSGKVSPSSVVKCLLENTSAYVYRLTITRGTVLVAELDRRSIESVPNWGTASASTVQALFAPGEADGDASVASASSSGVEAEPEARQNMTRREQLGTEAMKAFNAARSNNIVKITRAIEVQDSSTHWAEIHGAAQMRNKLREMADGQMALTEAAEFFGNTMDQYRRAMVAAGLDREYIGAVMRSNPFREADDSQIIMGVIQLTQNRGNFAVQRLNALADSFGEWRYDPDTKLIQFDNLKTANQYGAANRQMEEAALGLEKAMAQWVQKSNAKK